MTGSGRLFDDDDREVSSRNDGRDFGDGRQYGGKPIIHRDQIHGDVQYDPLSVALLNTSALQRLGRVYQLGYSHLVFRGGTHTRLSHVMGAAYTATKIVDSLRYNYTQKRGVHPRHVAVPTEFLPFANVPGVELDDQWDVLRHLVAWAALLHDVGHVPMGHTLEDEFEGIFDKHDDFASPRTMHLWSEDGEIYRQLTNESLYPQSFRSCNIKGRQVWQTILLICFHKDVGADREGRYFDFKTFLEFKEKSAKPKLEDLNKKMDEPGPGEEELAQYKTQIASLKRETKFTPILLDALRSTTDIFKPYMADIVANTICADYLDYLRRDPLNVGLDVLRDDRTISQFYVSADGPRREKAYRMALALVDRHGKPRLDVCTSVVELVRQR